MVVKPKGFTLVEVIVILAVLAILAGIAVPTALRIFQATTEDATREEMANLKKAIIGDSAKLQSATRSDFGFLGDIGCLPTDAFPSAPALDRLLTQGTYPFPWSFNSAAQIGAGWKGPYITGAATGQESETFTKDQWGNDYTYTPAAVACPLTATFRSAGPNGIFDGPPPAGDDIDFSIAASDTTSTVSGFIKDASGNPVPGSTVTLNFPSNGTVTTSPAATADSTGRFQFIDVPFGKKSINVTPKLIVTSARATIAEVNNAAICGGGNSRTNRCQYLEFTLVNFSSSPVTVSSLTPVYSTAPTAFYYQILWSTTLVFDCDAAGCVGSSGATKTFAGQAIAAAGTPLQPITFISDSSQTELSDIKIGAAGQVGTSVRVRLVNFRDNGTRSDRGNSVSVNGVTFAITFSDGSVVRFTPTATP